MSNHRHADPVFVVELASTDDTDAHPSDTTGEGRRVDLRCLPKDDAVEAARDDLDLRSPLPSRSCLVDCLAAAHAVELQVIQPRLAGRLSD